MTRREKAVELFRNRFNCSQAVFAAYRDEGELGEQAALRLATAFGAGLASTGTGLCGAAAGALLALSMKHGMGSVESLEAKGKTYALGRSFLAEFEAKNGSCICERILGLNLGVPGNLERAREMKLFETRCVDAVKSAADILEKLL